MLRDLTIENYRCFKHLQVDDLAQINLIVGKNNSGKTSFLEAVLMLWDQGNAQNLFRVLDSRGEFVTSPVSSETPTRTIDYQLKHIFHNHHLSQNYHVSVRSQQDRPLYLRISFVDTSIPNSVTPGSLFLTPDGFGSELPKYLLSLMYGLGGVSISIPILSNGSVAIQTIQTLKQNAPEFFYARDPVAFIVATKPNHEDMAFLWDDIQMTPKEEHIIAALRILEPDVERIGFSSRHSHSSGIRIKLQRHDEPIPLGSMGEGMSRILNIAMMTVTAENGILLVDDIDTGLHYSAQADMWKLVIETAKKLNVQVFATTHSWDCISAFQEALAEQENQAVGKLIRISQKGELSRAVEYAPDELSVAVRQSIEVR